MCIKIAGAGFLQIKKNMVRIIMRKKVGARKAVFLLCCLCMLGFSACGRKSDGDGNTGGAANGKSEDAAVAGTSVTVKKDGRIISDIVEDFGESYYDVDGLKSMIETSIEEYAATDPSAEIRLKSCDFSKGVVKVRMEFGNYSSYAGFNNEYFFAGTIQAANQAGIDLNMNLNAVSGKSEKESISKPELLGMGDSHIVFLEAAGADGTEEQALDTETVRVECFGEILYVGEGVTPVGKKSADVQLTGGYGVIVFK